MLKEGIAITFEEFLIINKGKIISDAKLDRMHSDWGYNDLTKLKILNKLTNIPKQEKYILDVENSIKDLKFSDFFRYLKDKDKDKEVKDGGTISDSGECTDSRGARAHEARAPRAI